MTTKLFSYYPSRRRFLKLAGGSMALAASSMLAPASMRKLLLPVSAAEAAEPYDLFFAGTDGWFNLPTGPSVNSPFHPDAYAEAPFTTYIFGFRNVTGMTDTQRQ